MHLTLSLHPPTFGRACPRPVAGLATEAGIVGEVQILPTAQHHHLPHLPHHLAAVVAVRGAHLTIVRITRHDQGAARRRPMGARVEADADEAVFDAWFIDSESWSDKDIRK